MSLIGVNLRHTKAKSLSLELSELKQRLSQNFQGFSITITNDDMEISGGNWVINDEKKEMLVGAYDDYLGKKISQLRSELGKLEIEIGKLEGRLKEIQSPEKEQRRDIHATYNGANRRWLDVKDSPSHPDYEKRRIERESTLAEVNDLTRLLQEREAMENRIKILQSELDFFLEDLKGLDIDILPGDFRRALEAVSILQHEETKNAQKHSGKSTVSTRKFALAVTSILLSAVGILGTFVLSKKTPGKVSDISVPESILRGGDVGKVEFLLGLDKASISTALEQLAQHGDLKVFNTTLRDTLRYNFTKVSMYEDPGEFTSEEGYYMTYNSLLNQTIELRVGVTNGQIESAMARYLAHLMREKGIAQRLKSVVDPLLLIAQSGHNPSNMENVINATIMSLMAELGSHIPADGCTVDIPRTKLIPQKGTGTDTYLLSIHYTIIGLTGDFAVEIPLN